LFCLGTEGSHEKIEEWLGTVGAKDEGAIPKGFVPFDMIDFFFNF
jgi:hypothetical protein